MTTTAHPAAGTALKTTLLGVMANAVLAAVKGVAGIVGNSYALVADAVESTFDILSSLVVLGGLKIAAAPADSDHPYGHGKAEPLAAMVVAVALCAAAVGIAVQSVREIITPHHAPAPFTLIVLVLVVAVKEVLYRYVLRRGIEAHSTAMKADAWHHRSDALTSFAAFVGISLALVGGEGYESADDWAALAASGVILVNGIRLLVPAVQEIMDAAPPPHIALTIRTAAEDVEGVMGIEKCSVRKMGLVYYVDLHVEVDGGMSVAEGHRISHDVKDAIRHAEPRVADVLVHIEPSPA